MANSSSVVFAGIAPHPPIMVPEVGREAIADVRSSIDAMADLTSRVIGSGAETIILISPHAPLEPYAFVAYEGPQLYGDFASFRAPTAVVHAQLDEELLDQITHAAAEQKLEVVRIRGFDLDHGTAAPLYFLQHNGWEGRVVALGYSFLPNEEHIRFGACIKQAIDAIGRPVAFIASGDLSHRLKRDAPAGHNTQAHLFDEEVVDAIRNSSTSRIVNMDQELRRLAGECGYRSMLVAIGVAQGLESRCEVINYEAPFGVGYLVAQLLAAGSADAGSADAGSADVSSAQRAQRAHPTAERADHAQSTAGVLGPSAQRAQRAQSFPAEAGADLPTLARETIETFVREGRVIAPPANLSELLNQRAACFVSVKTPSGDLRGCIGTIEPVKDTLAQEVIANAVSAATRDPRFAPVGADELSGLKYSVDVLSPPEPANLEDLDPQIYGVIVGDQSGLKGLLLPNLDGVDTVAKQLDCLTKGRNRAWL